MKILLTMNLPYVPAHGGANKGNRWLLEGLADRGHAALAVVPMLGTPTRMTGAGFLEELAALGVSPHSTPRVHSFELNRVRIRAVIDPGHLRNELIAAIRDVEPDWILVSSEDPSQNLLDAALSTGDSRVVYLARTTSFLPFGPQAFYPNARRGRLLERVHAVVALSDFVAGYLKQWGGIDSTVVPLSFFGRGPFPRFGRFDEGFITMVNPCAVKGISIFVALARALPDRAFAAVPTWGTTEADLAMLAAVPNIRILAATENVDDIFSRTRVLLVPSLWAEARGRIIVEAMLRGIPVMASDVGGIGEALRGAGFLLPVDPIDRFDDRLDGNFLPVAQVPPQDIEPWSATLRRLLTDRGFYEAESDRARTASHDFVSGLSVEPLERMLAGRRTADAIAGDPVAPGSGSAVSDAAIAPLTAKRRALLEHRLSERSGRRDGPRPAQRGGGLPLSSAQQRLWIIDRIAPGRPFYNVPVALRLRGTLRVAALQRALDEVIRRHEILRTRFGSVDGEPRQVILPDVGVDIPLRDLSAKDAEEREREAARVMSECARHPFDLADAPLLRVELIRLSDCEHILVLVMHHIICDGWSMGVLFAEIAQLYRDVVTGSAVRLPALPIQYADYAAWQQRRLEAPGMREHLAYWRKRLAGAPALSELPTDLPRPPVNALRAGRVSFHWPQEIARGLQELSRREDATTFMAMLCGLSLVLGRWSRQDDLVIGVPMAGRHVPDVEPLIGPFINPLPLRMDLSGNPSFRELLARTRTVVLDGYHHQDLPFEKLLDDLLPERSFSHAPLFQIMFRLEQDSIAPVELPALTISPIDIDTGSVNLDLALSAEEAPDGIRGRAIFNTDLYKEETISRLLETWRMALTSAIQDPGCAIGSIRLLTAAAEQQIVDRWNRTDQPLGRECCLHELVEEQVRRTPDLPAIRFRDATLTYADADRRSNALAHRLRSCGAGPEAVVGVLLPRSTELPLALLAVLKTGAAYLPLDPELPASRLGFVADDARLRCVITNGDLRDSVAAVEHVIDVDTATVDGELGATPPDPRVTPHNAAYVIYTSGSTGAPKGAVNTHRGIVNRLRWMQSAYRLTGADRVLQKTPFTFDVSVWEFFWPLISGACLVLAEPGAHRDVQRLADTIADERITVVHFVPSVLDLLLRADRLDKCRSLRRVICSGEVLTRELQERFFQQCSAELHNLYGPTEAAVDVTHWTCVRDGGVAAVPIGRPIANARAYILDPDLHPVPAGALGELHIGGVPVGRGYLGRPDLTASRFVPDPFSPQQQPGARMYKTGDLARFSSDGNVEFLGRLDHQVKIRGVRIELGDIEAAVETHPAIQRAVVIAVDQNSSDARLVAYVVTRDGTALDWPAVRQDLRQSLPDYMIPTAFIPVPALPLTTSGKVDRRALPPPPHAQSVCEQPHVPPRNKTEWLLTVMWEDLLPVRPVGVTADFFLLGGHSMLAVRLLASIEKQWGRAISLAAFFSGPTIEQVACALQRAESAVGGLLVPIRPAGERPPLFLVHPASGNVLCYYDLVRCLPADQPVYGLQSQGFDGSRSPLTDIPSMASRYVDEIRTVQPSGPYRIGGWSLGGAIAFEMAAQIVRDGDRVTSVLLLDSIARAAHDSDSMPADASLLCEALAAEGMSLQRRTAGSSDINELLADALALATKAGRVPPGMTLREFRGQFDIYKANVAAARRYVPAPQPLHVTLFRTETRDLLPARGWDGVARNGVRIITVPGDHHTMVKPPHAGILARAVESALASDPVLAVSTYA